MAVFRIEKTRDYTVMSNHHLRNTALSLKAKGLLSLMSIASITASVTHSLLAASTAKSHAGRSAAHSTASGPRLS